MISHSRVGFFSSTTTISSSPLSEAADQVGVEGDRHAELQDPYPGGGDGGLGRPGRARRSAASICVVGEAGGHQPDPGVGRVGGDPVQFDCRSPHSGSARGSRISRNSRSISSIRRPEEHGPRAVQCPAARPSTSTVGMHRIGTVRAGTMHRAGAVGDGGDDLHRRPESRGPGDGHGVEAELEALGDRARVEDGHVEVDQGGVR